MRVAFYSPIAKPSDTTPSGISRVGALLVQALQTAGHTVDTPPLPRSYEGKGDAARQAHIFSECENAATNYLEAIALGREPRPDLWFSYHVYYKSPDWIGPHVAKSLGIPYVVAEGSHAPKREKGPWSLGHEGTTKALQTADRLLAMTSFDRVCLEWIDKDRVRDLKPFIDTAPFSSTPAGDHRIIAVGMMRNERKRQSYMHLATVFRMFPKFGLELKIIGDGVYRTEIEEMFMPVMKKHRVTFAGTVPSHDVPHHLASAGILAWPGIGEAYGLVYLEAQAAGLAVVACSNRGVTDVTRDGVTALLSEPGGYGSYADNLWRMIREPELRAEFGANARAFVQSEHSITAASLTLNRIFAELKST
jgi:glycosyltransferase involved in cell wall biosynthesis